MFMHKDNVRCRDPRCRCHSISSGGFIKSYVFSDKKQFRPSLPVCLNNVYDSVCIHLESLGQLCSSGNIIPGHIKASLSSNSRQLASFSITIPGKIDLKVLPDIEPQHELTEYSLALNIMLVGEKIPSQDALAAEINDFFNNEY